MINVIVIFNTDIGTLTASPTREDIEKWNEEWEDAGTSSLHMHSDCSQLIHKYIISGI